MIIQSIGNCQFLSQPDTWQMMFFLNPLDALIPKDPFSLFAEFWVPALSGARGSVLVGFWGGRQLSLLGGGLARGLYRAPPPQLKAHPPQCIQLPELQNKNGRTNVFGIIVPSQKDIRGPPLVVGCNRCTSLC